MQLMDSKASDRVNRLLYETDYLHVTIYVIYIRQLAQFFLIKNFLKLFGSVTQIDYNDYFFAGWRKHRGA